MPCFTHNSADLYYELDGSGPPAVFIVGYSDHINSVPAVIFRQAFSQHFRLLAMDNRGAGRTTIPDDALVSIDMMADDIAALLEHLLMSPVHVCGVSMGGAVAMTLALRHPEKVRSLVAVVSMAHLDDKRSEFMVRSTRIMIDQGVPRDAINRFNALAALGASVFEDDAFIQTWINAPADPLEQTSSGSRQQIEAMRTYDIRNRLNQITAPTLVLSSSEDLLVPQKHQLELAENIPGARFKSYLGGHVFSLLPPYAPQFINDILDFWYQHSN